MMTWLRKRNREIMLLTFGTFVIGGVVFTGAQGMGQTGFSPALIVNGEKISYNRFQARLRQNVDRQGAAGLSEDKREALKRSTREEMVQETAILQEARRYGLTVTDGEVAAFIQSIPAFQQDGHFDPNRYMTVLTQQLRVTPSEFEEDRRRDILRQKLIMFLSSSIKVSEDEAKTFLHRHAAEIPAKDLKELASDPAKLMNVVGQEEGNAVFRAWIQQMQGRLKVEDRLDRWGKS
jgi:hypothetical protein